MNNKMQNFNYHTHTKRCRHADLDLSDEDYVLEFLKKGFQVIAFTDHCPEKEVIDIRDNMRMVYSEKDEYLNSIKFLKNKYKNRISIKSGFEIEYLPGQEKNLLELRKDVDLMILGQHFVYDENKDLKIFRHQEFTNNDLFLYASYIEEALKLGIVDIIAHPDIYMLSRDKFDDVCLEVAKRIGSAAEKYDIPLEINLCEIAIYLSRDDPSRIGGWKVNGFSYPNRDFWQVISNYNVKVLYGIDAHYKSQIELYEESISFANKLIGKDVIDKLNFCDFNFNAINKKDNKSYKMRNN